VSLKYAVPVDELKKLNNLTGTTLEEGMRLKVPLLDQ
jgi:LysM repeat protein